MKHLHRIIFLTLVLGAVSCATYYQKHYDCNSELETGDLSGALEVLHKKEALANSKSKFLYFVNKGLLLSIMGKYACSIEYLWRAYLFAEDYHINYFHEAAGYFSNPNMSVYRGYDHEHLMLLYFKAINFLKMQRPEDALVECRRLNIR